MQAVDDQLEVQVFNGESASIWRAFPEAVAMLLLRHGEDSLYLRMYEEEDALLSEYAESGKPVPGSVVVLLRGMVGRYGEALSEIERRKSRLHRGVVVVMTRDCFSSPDPEEAFHLRMQDGLFDVFFQYDILGYVNMDDSELKELFLHRVEERLLIGKKRRKEAMTPRQPQKRVQANARIPVKLRPRSLHA